MSEKKGNVVDFPGRGFKRDAHDAPKPGMPADQAVRRVKKLETPAERQERAQVIRDNIDRGMKFRSGENLIAARAMDKFLTHMSEQHHQNKGALLYYGGGKGADAKTASRYLSEYALPEGKEPSSKRGPSKKPTTFKKLAEGVAKWSKTSRDDALLWIFEATSLADRIDPNLPEAGAYAELVDRINQIAAHVSEKHHLQHYFRDLHRLRAEFHIFDESMRQSWLAQNDQLPNNYVEGAGVCVIFGGSDPTHQGPDYRVEFGRPTAPMPGLDARAYLLLEPEPYAKMIRSPFPILPLACVLAHAIELKKFSDEPDEGRPIPYTPPFGRGYLTVTMELRACISLCIVPVGQDYQPRAAILVTLWPEFYDGDPASGLHGHPHDLEAVWSEDAIRFINTFYDPPDTFWVDSDGDHLLPSNLPSVIRDHFFIESRRPLEFGFGEARENTRFLPVTTRCRNILELSLDHARIPKANYLLPSDPICVPGSDPDQGFSEFPAGTIAACLDRMMWDISPTLTERLDTLSADLTNTFWRACDMRKHDRKRALDELENRIKPIG